MPRTKPISEKQLAANRRNAKSSTGPSSDAGRKTVSLNAVKHGLTGHVAVLPNEDIAAHQTFCSELIDEMAPANAMELNLAQSIAQDLWRLNRAHAIENNMFAVGVTEDDPDPDHDPAKQLALASARTFMNHANKFGLLTIYEQRINRAVHKNRAELRLMQMERRQARQTCLEQMAFDQIAAERTQAKTTPRESQPEPHAAAPAPIPINALRTQTAPNGFVYANEVSAPPPGGFTLEKDCGRGDTERGGFGFSAAANAPVTRLPAIPVDSHPRQRID
jgi:hypothetical protein